MLLSKLKQNPRRTTHLTCSTDEMNNILYLSSIFHWIESRHVINGILIQPLEMIVK